jgi:hypothetical protein
LAALDARAWQQPVRSEVCASACVVRRSTNEHTNVAPHLANSCRSVRHFQQAVRETSRIAAGITLSINGFAPMLLHETMPDQRVSAGRN